MQFLTLEQVRFQCRLDEDDTSEDQQLTLYATAAEQAVEQHLNRKLYKDKVPEEDSTGLVVKEIHKSAMLVMAAQLYENREATSDLTMKEVPLAYHYLLQGDRIIPV